MDLINIFLLMFLHLDFVVFLQKVFSCILAGNYSWNCGPLLVCSFHVLESCTTTFNCLRFLTSNWHDPCTVVQISLCALWSRIFLTGEGPIRQKARAILLYPFSQSTETAQCPVLKNSCFHIFCLIFQFLQQRINVVSFIPS